MQAIHEIESISTASMEASSLGDNDLIIGDGSADEWYVLMGLRPALHSTMTDTLGTYFKSLLDGEPGVLGIYWCYEGETVRIWTAIEDMDFSVEAGIYDAQTRFLDRMDDIECDFSVIYRQGRDLNALLPTGLLAVP